MVQVVLPNDANPLGFLLGGTVMHLIDIAGAIASFRHARSRVVTAAVDDLVFLHPIKVGDLIVLKATVTCTFRTSLEVRVDVFSEEALTGVRQRTSRAFLTFVAVDEAGGRVEVPPLLVETPEQEKVVRRRPRPPRPAAQAEGGHGVGRSGGRVGRAGRLAFGSG